MFISESKIKVRYAETDQMGVVHHSNYAIWFELGRTEFLAQLGMPYSTVESRGVLLPVIELKCTFKGAAKYEDESLLKPGRSMSPGSRWNSITRSLKIHQQF
jgi:acyl-CoA thioester hydrolase